MINRYFPFPLAAVLALALAATPSLSFAQATTNAPAAAPTASAATPPVATTDATAPAERPATYTLQPGDTLEKVAKQYGLTGRQLQKYNKFTNKQVRRLQIGQVVKIPPAKPEAAAK